MYVEDKKQSIYSAWYYLKFQSSIRGLRTYRLWIKGHSCIFEVYLGLVAYIFNYHWLPSSDILLLPV